MVVLVKGGLLMQRIPMLLAAGAKQWEAAVEQSMHKPVKQKVRPKSMESLMTRLMQSQVKNAMKESQV
jgi:hypothetical protein